LAGAGKDASPRPDRGPDDSSRLRAMRSPAAIAVFAAVAGVSLAADLWSKHAVFGVLLGGSGVRQRSEAVLRDYGPNVPPDDVLRALRLQRPVFTGLRLTLSTNPGVVFGLPMPPWAVAVATVLTIGLVCYFFAMSGSSGRWLHVALAMVLSGAVGNFYDRMIAHVVVPGVARPITGQVRDFLDFSEVRVLGLNYPYIFNVADVFLVVGVGMLMVYWWFLARCDHKSRLKKQVR